MLVIIMLAFSMCFAQIDSGLPPAPMQPVSVEAFLSSQDVHLDDTLVAIIKITAFGDPWNWLVDSLILPDVRNLKLLNTGVEAEHSVGEQKRTIIKKIIRYLPIEQGDASIGNTSVHLLYLPESTGIWLKTDPLSARVIKPRHGKIKIHWAVAALVSAIVLVAGVAFIFAHRRVKRAGTEEKQPSFENEIMENLSKIDVRRTSPDIASDKIARAIRDYISKRYNISAYGMSTAEILSALSNIGMMGKLYSDVEEVLKLCDDIRFAGGQRTADEISDALAKVKNFIIQTSGGVK